MSCGACTKQPETKPAPPEVACPTGEVVRTEGEPGKLALLVGVGEYAAEGISDLSGPPADVELMKFVLTDPKVGYGFPRENVCILLDEEATVANVRNAFEALLIDRARPGDQVLFYYSGHGSQAFDRNGDELEDNLDETYVLHDSRTAGVSDLRDDWVNVYLKQIGDKIRPAEGEDADLTVLLDSCHSGSAARGDGQVVRRLNDRAPQPPDEPETGSEDFEPDDLPGLVMLTGAADGAFSLEPAKGGAGFFTRAVAETLTEVRREPLTWRTVSRRVASKLETATQGQQRPTAQGQLERLVFGANDRVRPFGWDVVDRPERGEVQLEGFAMPGWGHKAVLRVYDGAVQLDDSLDPDQAKAVLEVTTYDGFRATARVLSLRDKRQFPIEPGDLAVLAIPSPTGARTKLAFQDQGPNALAAEDIERFEAKLRDPELVGYDRVAVPATRDEAVVVVDQVGGELRVREPNGRVHPGFGSIDRVVKLLGGLARQHVLLTLRGETGGKYVNNDTLQVELVPAERQKYDCPVDRLPYWVQACPNARQVVPLCTSWRIRVTSTASQRLYIGGAILLQNGAIVPFPPQRGGLSAEPGEPMLIESGRTWVTGSPPIDQVEYVVVFGTEEPVDWQQLGTKGVSKGTDRPQSALAQIFGQLASGSKGLDEFQWNDFTLPWTSTVVPFRNVANPQLEPYDEADLECAGTPRESTLPFEIGPFVPTNDPALAKVLEVADSLTRTAASDDGVPYKQHSWRQGSGRATPADDERNLAVGIDCSRAIWYAFTRAGLPYTSTDTWRGEGYVPTAYMFPKDKDSCIADTPTSSPMSEHFEDCLGLPLRTGDVLVYQGEKTLDNGKKRCVGHTVMVIDPDTYVGWGSHGFDTGSLSGLPVPDTGVEYQRIRAKTWLKWDRRAYALKACWRHKAFYRPPVTGEEGPAVENRAELYVPGENFLPRNYCQTTCELVP